MSSYLNQTEPIYQIPNLRHDIKVEDEPTGKASPQFEYTLLRAQVDEIIDQGLNDMSLLINGEEMDTRYPEGIWKDGKAFAMVNGNQVNLLGSKFSAMNALLSVGIALY